MRGYQTVSSLLNTVQDLLLCLRFFPQTRVESSDALDTVLLLPQASGVARSMEGVRRLIMRCGGVHVGQSRNWVGPGQVARLAAEMAVTKFTMESTTTHVISFQLIQRS